MTSATSPSRPAMWADARGIDPTPVWRDRVGDFMRKQLAAVPAALYRERYPEIRSLDPFYLATGGFKGIPAENNVVRRNICVGKWLDLGWHAKPEGFPQEDNVTTGDPGFVNAAAQDFRLRSDSPVYKVGIQPVPFEKMGLQKDPERARLGRLN